jgi:SAM-dependent methyltransferase
MYRRTDGTSMSIPEDRSYVIGTHDAEIERLRLQHQLWRHRVLDCWRRAKLRRGYRIADIGAGPGYASLDLADLVGPTGHVYAVERSRRFLSVLIETMQERRICNVTAEEADLEAGDLPFRELDATWCRWVLCFLRQPEALVRRIAHSLRPGGCAIFHEYVDYQSWRAAPPLPSLARFVSAVMSSWRNDGGEPNIGLYLPGMLGKAGLRVIAAEPVSYFLSSEEPLWAWLAAFIETGPQRLVELAMMTASEAEELRTDFRQFGARSEARMLTPTVLEVLSVKE